MLDRIHQLNGITLIAVLLPWSNGACNILIYVLAAYQSYQIFKNQDYPKNFPRAFFILLLLFFLANAISLLQLDNYKNGIGNVARLVGLLSLPLVVFFENKKALNVERILKCYMHSTAFLGIITVLLAFFKWLYYGRIEPFLEKASYEGLSNIVVHHQPIYFGIFIGIGAILALHFFISNTNSKLRFLYLIESIFLLGFLFLLGTRTSIASCIICLLLLSFKYSKRFTGLFLVFSIVLTVFNYTYNSSFKDRINHVLEFSTDFDYKSDWSYGGLAFRYMTWNCSIEVIEDNLTFGTGVGGAQNKMNDCFKKNNYESLLYFIQTDGKKFNAHNLFLEVFMTTGIMGITTLFFLLAHHFYTIYNSRNVLFLCFILFFLLNGLTESLFVREKGIMVYAFFVSLFTLGCLPKPLNSYQQ